MLRTVGRYAIYDEIASGGMATVYLARQRGEVGFARVVAVKMLHAQYAREESFRAMFLDEARLASRIGHPSVVATLDVVQDDGELFLVMEYVHGETLARLLRGAAALGERVPLDLIVAIVTDVLEGLHAAHEATSETGEPLHIVHRDVSPQNVLVAAEGVALVADFGVAKAAGRLAAKYSNEGAKGKAGYMPPEQMRGGGDRRSDVFAAGVVLWEALVGQRLFTGESFLEIVTKVMDAPVPPPSTLRQDVPAALDAIVKRAVAHDPARRFATAREMAVALEAAHPRASGRDVGDWVKRIAGESLAVRRARIERIEAATPESKSADAAAAAAVSTQSLPEVETVSGLVPAAPRVAPSRPRLSWWLGGGVASAAAAIGFMLFRHGGGAPPVSGTGASPVPTFVAPAAIDAVPSSPPPLPAPTASPSDAGALAAAPAASSRPPIRGGSRRPGPPPPPVPSPSATCHWVELPGPDGIIIPKKVCP